LSSKFEKRWLCVLAGFGYFIVPIMMEMHFW